jgi:predicted GNAT superfamily acetyltransferase
MVCGRDGETQASHSNQQRDGKGMGIKAHDYRIAAICAPCHTEIDQGKAMTKEERRNAWDEAHRATIGALFEMGALIVKKG